MNSLRDLRDALSGLEDEVLETPLVYHHAGPVTSVIACWFGSSGGAQYASGPEAGGQPSTTSPAASPGAPPARGRRP